MKTTAKFLIMLVLLAGVIVFALCMPDESLSQGVYDTMIILTKVACIGCILLMRYLDRAWAD
jgi:hypothetical protein